MTRPPTSKSRLAALALAPLLALLLSSAFVVPRARAAGGGPPRAPQPSTVRFAAVGDFGDDSRNGPVVAAVAKLVKGWNPEFVITLGDNNYNCGEQKTIAENITKHYGDFIKPGGENRFFPVLGNHDWGHNWGGNKPAVCKNKPPHQHVCAAQDIGPYLALFDLPGNERYYEFVRGPVHFFALDSDCHEPDGITPDSDQARWLRGALENSTARYKIVYMHHPPFSSGSHGSQKELQWDFKKWGATLVMAGHKHSYERLHAHGLPYIVNGSGGRVLRPFKKASKLPSSLYQNGTDYGAMLINADERKMTLQFFSQEGKLLDHCSIRGEGGGNIGKQCWQK
jgi:tartrate-resistant acid phosphatase type 5